MNTNTPEPQQQEPEFLGYAEDGMAIYRVPFQF